MKVARLRTSLTLLLPLLALPARAEDGFDATLKSIQPSAEELAWQAIPWRPAFKGAVAEAQKAGKPVLLWAMNGHPLACT